MNILDQKRLTKLDRILQNTQEILMSLFDSLYVIALFHALDPFVGLVLRIDHERPSIGVERYERVLDRECVDRQPVNLPLADFHRFAKCRQQ